MSMHTAPIEQQAYNTDEAALYVGHKPTTLKYWRRRGIGPRYYRSGRHVMYRKVRLDEWLAEQEQAS